jgi:hypothetical protein
MHIASCHACMHGTSKLPSDVAAWLLTLHDCGCCRCAACPISSPHPPCFPFLSLCHCLQTAFSNLPLTIIPSSMGSGLPVNNPAPSNVTVYNNGLGPGWRSSSFGCTDCDFNDTKRVGAALHVCIQCMFALDSVLSIPCSRFRRVLDAADLYDLWPG